MPVKPQNIWQWMDYWWNWSGERTASDPAVCPCWNALVIDLWELLVLNVVRLPLYNQWISYPTTNCVCVVVHMCKCEWFCMCMYTCVPMLPLSSPWCSHLTTPVQPRIDGVLMSGWASRIEGQLENVAAVIIHTCWLKLCCLSGN